MESIYNPSHSTNLHIFLFPQHLPEKSDRLDKQLEGYFKRNSVTATELKAQANKAEGETNATSTDNKNDAAEQHQEGNTNNTGEKNDAVEGQHE